MLEPAQALVLARARMLWAIAVMFLPSARDWPRRWGIFFPLPLGQAQAQGICSFIYFLLFLSY
jgi:hypothetical protein